MRLRNTTDIPNETVKEIVRFVRPSGISGFDIELRNSGGKHCVGRAYWGGSGYHDRAVPFVVLRLPRETYPQWEKFSCGKKWTMHEIPFSDQKGWKRVNNPSLPQRIHTYQYGQLRGRRYYAANRIELLVYLAAHELRHLWQAKTKNKSGYAWGSRGRFSEIDTDSYAIRKLREWRKSH